MAEHIHTYSHRATDARDRSYQVHAYGEESELGTWHGWLVFEPEDGAGARLRTDRETTQPNREDLEYWASGLEAIYLDGALGRAAPG